MRSVEQYQLDQLTRRAGMVAIQRTFEERSYADRRVKAANGKHKRKYRWCASCKRPVRVGRRHDERKHPQVTA